MKESIMAGMEGINGTSRLIALDRGNYFRFREEVVALYLNAYTTGEYAQHITPEEAVKELDATMEHGFGRLAFVDEQMAGAVLAMSLVRHADFPEVGVPGLDHECTLYIADVMVHTRFRGRKIATTLMQELLAESSGFSAAVIRVWEENRPAMHLYRKMGFRPIAAITQTKRYSPEEAFEMRKIYMHRSLESD